MTDNETMDDLHPIELSKILSRAEAARAAWRQRLRSNPSLDDTPLQIFRRYLTTESFHYVSDLEPLDPLREPLLRWMLVLTLDRVNQEWLARAQIERRVDQHPGAESSETHRTLSQLLKLAFVQPERADAAFDTMLRHGRAVASTTRAIYDRQIEAGVRLKLDAPLSLLDPGADLTSEAEKWLEQTNELYYNVQPQGFGEWLNAALGRNIPGEWPARLNEATIGDWFRETPLLRDLPLDLGPLPERYGPASFVRSLDLLGRGLRRCLAPQAQPFVVARDPGALAEYTTGALFAGLFLESKFIHDVVGTSRGGLANYLRPAAQMWLCATRLCAIQVLVRRAAWESTKDAQVLASEALSAEWHRDVPAEVALGVLAMQPQAAARFAGVFEAECSRKRLIESHDEDWYRNPRAADEVRSDAERPPQGEVDRATVAAGMQSLCARLVEHLG